jgi:glutamate racemase
MKKEKTGVDEAATKAPVGFFDSGVGGLSILMAARRILPFENLIYFADSAHCPYGSKNGEFVRRRALAISRFLLDRGAKAIVVACNSASEVALEFLRRTFSDLEVIGVEPAVKVAQGLSRNQKIGILATPLTLKGRRLSRLLENFSSGMQVYTQPVPGLVKRIETGRFDDPRMSAILEKNLRPLLAKGIDTLVLGCTHYPIIKDRIAALCGPRVGVIDTGEPVARQLWRRLLLTGRLNPGPGAGKIEYFSSGDAKTASAVLGAIMADPGLVAARSPV